MSFAIFITHSLRKRTDERKMWQTNFALSISTIVLSAGVHCTEIYRLNITDPDLSNLAVTLSGLFQDQYLYQPFYVYSVLVYI